MIKTINYYTNNNHFALNECYGTNNWLKYNECYILSNLVTVKSYKNSYFQLNF